MLIIEFHSTGNGLGQSEATGGSLGPVELLPNGLSHILGNQGMLGLDLWEGVGHREAVQVEGHERNKKSLKVEQF